MRGEIYVLSLLRVSELAENVATEHLRGPMVTNNVAAELTDPDRRHLTGPRYEYLALKLAEAFKPAPPPRFTEANFLDLLQPAVRQELGRVLGCPPDDALASLFDPVRIRRELDQVGRRSPRPVADVESLLYELLTGGSDKMVTRIRRRYQFNENAWGSHLQRRRWLLDSAVEHLQREAARRGWTRTEAGRALAGVIARAGRPADDLSLTDDAYDALAVVYLRRLAAGLVSDLREEAESNIDRAAAKVSTMTGLVKLRGWVDLYERRHLARGLLKLCGGTLPLHRMILRERCTDKQVYATYEKPLQPDRLVVGNINEYSKREGLTGYREYVTFDIQCRFGDAPDPTTVLTVARLPREEFRRVRAAIERLRGDDLSAQGPTVGERVLNTGVPVTEGLQGLLRGYVERNTALVAQTIVLSGIQQPVTAVSVPWRHSLRDNLGYAPRDGAGDVSFPQDIRQIVDELTKQYETGGKRLVIDRDQP